MKYSPDIHHRHSIRLKGYDYSQAGAYSVTLCVQGRECFFGDVLHGDLRLKEYGLVVGECTSKVLVPGQLPIFSNVDDGAWAARPNAILIDSEQLESGEAMSADFKKIAAREIEEFKAEYRVRFPDRDPESLTDEDLLREVMNTVGKLGKLGEQVKCVVSVSMLTEPSTTSSGIESKRSPSFSPSSPWRDTSATTTGT